MTRNKDLKRLVRARMHKTGESYTSARSHLLGDPMTRTPQSARAERRTEAASYATLAGITDASLKAATGCTWERWVKALDHHGARDLAHAAIARLVREKYGTPSWWAQSVTVGYERIRGVRVRGQRPDGTFSATKSRTFSVRVAAL